MSRLLFHRTIIRSSRHESPHRPASAVLPTAAPSRTERRPRKLGPVSPALLAFAGGAVSGRRQTRQELLAGLRFREQLDEINGR